ncbi:hypothetical protein BJX76DRAFT_361800 [Aspergillus varians]
MSPTPEALQPKALLAHPKVLAPHLRALAAADASIENLTSISSCILDQVHTEAVPASAFEVWLQLTCKHSFWHFTATALQDPSYGVRAAAIRVAHRHLFRLSHWKERGWDVLGGAQGIKDILDSLPLAEVRLLVKAIFGCCSAVSSGRTLVSACVEEFLALVEGTDRWASRSLLPHVSYLSAYCSEERIKQLLRSKSAMSSAILRYGPTFHTPLLRLMGVGAVHVPNDVRLEILQECRRTLLSSREAYVPIYYEGKQSAMSPGLVFGMDLLMVMEKEPEQHGDYELGQWVESILKKGFRENLPFKSILLILNQALDALQAGELTRPRGSMGWLSQSISQDIVQFWSISQFGRVGDFPRGLVARYRKKRRARTLSAHQGALEQCLIQEVLQIKDERVSVQKNRRQFSETITSLLGLVHKKGRLEFLQLLCRYSPSLEFDLTAWPPSKKEEELMPCWHLDILHMLMPDDSKSLFRRSLHIHHCEEFLPTSGIRDPGLEIPSWEAQCLLWATWESAGPKKNGFPVTRKALVEMKQKSMRGREPPERLRWAQQAIKLAVKTGSVDIFAEIVEWSKRFIRDPMVFGGLICDIIDRCNVMLSCRVGSQGVTSVSKSRLLQEAQTGHKVLEDLLQIALLLLREPWARSLVANMTRMIPSMLSTILGHRMNVVRKRPCGEAVTESEVAGILLEPMMPILIEYEREGNADGQANVKWSSPSGMIISHQLPSDPNLLELSFMDQLAKARDEFWQRHRARNDPNILDLSAGWPRGLPIQHLVASPIWLSHAMRHQEHAPFISSRANRVLFSTVDAVMVVIKNKKEHAGEFVDDLGFICRALLANDKLADRARDVLRVWEHYSQLLQPHPAYLGLFQNWLADMIQYQDGMYEVTNIIRPRPSQTVPNVSAVPAGSEIIEWDPYEGDYSDFKTYFDNKKEIETEEPPKIPCTIFTCRMEGKLPSGTPFVRASTPRSKPEPPVSIWSSDYCSSWADWQDPSRRVQDSVVLAALLFLDTYTKTPRILRTKFPDVDSPRYTPIYLADEFIACYQAKQNRPRKALNKTIGALRRSASRVPAHLLRDLIWSFLDTLKADPKAPMYSTLLFSTFNLIEVLLCTDKPQLAIDVVIRLWKEFPNDSSLHRKISLVRLGRIFTPAQARGMMSTFSGYVCDALLQAQQSQQQQQVKEKNQAFIKVTTAKMLAQALAQADFLSQSDQMEMLQRMFNSTRHVDIQTEIVEALLELVAASDNAEPYKLFASIASSVTEPSERAKTTQAEWEIAENGVGPLPYVAPVAERPVLQLVVGTASHKLPEKSRPDYVQNVLLPLLQESTRQHTRWMAAMTRRLGLSLSDLNLTEQDIGPFAPDLPNTILSKWPEYLPGSYLQRHHRPWALSYLQHESFSQIDKALAVTADGALKEIKVRDHWNIFLNAQRTRPAPINSLNSVRYWMVNKAPEASNGLTTALILEEFAFRAEVMARNPVRYNTSLLRDTLRTEYALDPLRALRKSRAEYCVSAISNPADKVTFYNVLTEAMAQAVDMCETVRKEGWSKTKLTAGFPTTVTTLPSTFEYSVLTLPSPIYNPAASASNPAVELFTSAIVALIARYARDPILLLTLDSLHPVLQEVPPAGLKTCTLRLGRGRNENELERHDTDLLVTCVRVKLARFLLERVRANDGALLDRDGDVEILGMIEEWKNSEVEFLAVKIYADLVQGPDHHSTRRITLALAQTYWNQGRGDEAAELQHTVLQACVASLGSDAYETLMAEELLEQTRWQQGRYSDVRALQQHAVDGLIKLNGIKNEDTLTAMGNLGRTQAKFYENLDQAKVLLTQSLDGMRTVLWPTHTKTLIMQEELALLALLMEEDLAKPLEMLQQVLDCRKEKLGREHPYTLLALSSLARVKTALGQHTEAETLVRSGLEIAERNLGENHIGTLMGKFILGAILTNQSRFAEAESTLLEVTEKQRHLSSYRGDFHPDRLGAMIELGAYSSAWVEILRTLVEPRNGETVQDTGQLTPLKANLTSLWVAFVS